MSFDEVLVAVERLTVDEQEELAAIVRRRLADRRRQEILREVQEARAEFARGGCRAATVDELMGEILP